jgi:hypothetical protein
MENHTEPTARARRRRLGSLRAAAAVVGLLLVAWITAGFLRADAVARDYFAHAHGSATVANVQSDAMTPGVPPFWQVQIRGDVIEPGRSGPAYQSSMRLWVEPITGFVIVMGAG